MASIRKIKKLLKNSRELREVSIKDESHAEFIQQNQVVVFTKFGITLCEDNGIPYVHIPYRRISQVIFAAKWWSNL